MNASDSAMVVAVIATFRRPDELRRLLDGLAASGRSLAAAIVVDNASDEACHAVVGSFRAMAERLVPGRNLGCGGGLKIGIERAFVRFTDRLTHLWILDDDAVVEPDTLGRLLVAGNDAAAEVVYPMIVDRAGRIGWFPGLLEEKPWRVIRQVTTPAEYLEACGPAVVPFSWCPGVSLLVAAHALRAVGPPRADYWVRGEDLEFSLRLTSRFRSAFVPDVVVQHVQAPMINTMARDSERYRYLAMMQNLGFTSCWLRHGRRMLRTLPGNSVRFFRAHGWTPRNAIGLARALWVGAVRGCPAGDRRGNALQLAAEM